MDMIVISLSTRLDDVKAKRAIETSELAVSEMKKPIAEADKNE